MLPLFRHWEGTAAGVRVASPYGCWILLGGLISALAGLFASPYIAWGKSSCGFLDFLCIHQTDEILMQQGINNLAGFLEASKELRVMWSPPLLSRLLGLRCSRALLLLLSWPGCWPRLCAVCKFYTG